MYASYGLRGRSACFRRGQTRESGDRLGTREKKKKKKTIKEREVDLTVCVFPNLQPRRACDHPRIKEREGMYASNDRELLQHITNLTLI
jgi:hypothetical protein